MIQDNTNNSLYQEEEGIDLLKEVRYYVFFWPYFIATMVLAGLIAYMYLRYEERIYQTGAQVQIKKGDSDPTSFLTEGAEGLLNFDKVNVENDIAVITSNLLLRQVVDRLDLQTTIISQGRIASMLQFNKELAFVASFKQDALFEKMDLIIAEGKATLVIDSSSYSLNRGEPLDLEFGTITPKDSLFLEEADYVISRVSLNEAVEQLRSGLSVSAASKQGEIVNIQFKGPNTKRNEAIVNTLIEVLKQDQVADKREISTVSIEFIDARLQGLTQSIDTISENTIAYQRANALFDPAQQTGNALSNIIKGQEEALNLGIQKEIASALLEGLKSQSDYELLPANVGVSSENVNGLISQYNEAVSQRKTLLMSATQRSPMVIQLTEQLAATRTAIISGIEQYISGLEVSLNRFGQLQRQTEAAVTGLPAKESALRGFARNFKIVEELYLFLLQRREEASISYISALPNVKVLSQAVTQTLPVSPKPQITYLAAIVIGLLVPFGILFIAKTLDTQINTREDLEQGLKGTTIVGEIPLEKDASKIDTPRGTIAEATRVMRSNLAFMLPHQGPVVLTSTSSIKGEGKSFVSFNIAQSYAALSKRVLLVGADLRNPQLHNRLGVERANKGLSTYLTHPESTDLKPLITVIENDPVHYLLSGAIPPNPSELLARPSMGLLIEELKKSYDVIIIDSAPLMLVSDTSPILTLSDLVIYVSRAQYTDKNVFAFIKDLQKRKNIPPLAMVLNGIIAGPTSYYKYGYAYRYSYKYKYNYGYGYGYGEDKA